ncbi:MAG: hypothetical protein FWF94_03010 [Oscillospiraceae bacterium]|nr:hypothetical protein [Oscillospiraceae bacterium]
MLFDALTTAFFAPFYFFIDLLPVIEYDFPNDIFNVLEDSLFIVNFFLPLGLYLNIIKMVLFLDVLQITISLLIRGKSFIPTMGS